jgi:hypothetical protein
MRTWTILAVALGLQISGYAAEDNVRTFRAVDPDLLARFAGFETGG